MKRRRSQLVEVPRVDVRRVRLDWWVERYGWRRGGMGGWVGIQPREWRVGGIMTFHARAGKRLIRRIVTIVTSRRALGGDGGRIVRKSTGLPAKHTAEVSPIKRAEFHCRPEIRSCWPRMTTLYIERCSKYER